MYSPLKISTKFLHTDLGTMQSSYCLTQPINSIVKSTPYPRTNNDNWTNSSTRIFAPDVFNLQNHPWPRPSSLLKRRTANFDLCKTIENLTRLRSKIATLSPLS